MKQMVLGLFLAVSPAVAHAEWREAPPAHGPREPPPPVVEEHPRARGGFIWVGGHHEWRHGHYFWVSGHLVRVRRGQEWSDGRWQRHGDHWDWYSGGWRPRR
jgi:hypothetical protein